ncbi:MAG: ATP-binding protein [Myxococcota bacterium]
MMHVLLPRLIVALVGAVALGTVAGAVTLAVLQGETERSVRRLLEGSGLGVVLHQLESSPQERWPDILAAAQPHIDFNLALADTSQVSSMAGTQPFGPPNTIHLPIGDTGQWLVMGPLGHPSPRIFLWPLAVFVITVVPTAAALVGLPLAAHIARLQKAVRLLGEGHWDVQLDTDTGGVLRTLAEDVNRSAAQLALLFQEREGLLQAVSHELGTPLSRMRFQVELIAPHIPPDQHTRLDALRRDLDELDALSSEMVGWVEAGIAPTQGLTHFEVLPALESLLELSCQDMDHLQTRVEGSPSLVVVVEPRHFQRAIENLLRNAIRYARCVLVVTAVQEDNQVVVQVRDDGPGIPEEQRLRLLEPFTRIERSRERQHGGLGLGLAIVHRIVTAHGGTVTIEEAPEGGACITTRWPTPP